MLTVYSEGRNCFGNMVELLRMRTKAEDKTTEAEEGSVACLASGGHAGAPTSRLRLSSVHSSQCTILRRPA